MIHPRKAKSDNKDTHVRAKHMAWMFSQWKRLQFSSTFSLRRSGAFGKWEQSMAPKTWGIWFKWVVGSHSPSDVGKWIRQHFCCNADSNTVGKYMEKTKLAHSKRLCCCWLDGVVAYKMEGCWGLLQSSPRTAIPFLWLHILQCKLGPAKAIMLHHLSIWERVSLKLVRLYQLQRA